MEHREIKDIVQELLNHPDVIFVQWYTKQDVVDHYNAATNDEFNLEVESITEDEFVEISDYCEGWFDNLWYNNDMPFPEIDDDYLPDLKMRLSRQEKINNLLEDKNKVN